MKLESPQQQSAGAAKPMRILFALPGLHRVDRGAEVAFESVAAELAQRPGVEVTLIGSGLSRPSRPYRFLHARCRSRERFERWPRVPVFRNHYVYEELTFIPGLWSAFDPGAFDITVTCSYPFVNWALRAKRRAGRPRHVFVTQNGDWPAYAGHREYRYFSCDGLVCTNPEFYQRNAARWRCALIPNGVDPGVFSPGTSDRSRFGIPLGARAAIMVSALIPSKRVVEGIQATALVPDLQLLVVGDGELRDQVDATGRALLGARYRRVVLPRESMPAAYRSADVFLHMSRVEPSANAYIEALATGLPVVTHDREVTRWTFEERALLVDTSDAGSVAGALRRALDIRIPEYVEGCRSLVERRFSWCTIAQSYADFFEGILDRAL